MFETFRIEFSSSWKYLTGHSGPLVWFSRKENKHKRLLHIKKSIFWQFGFIHLGDALLSLLSICNSLRVKASVLLICNCLFSFVLLGINSIVLSSMERRELGWQIHSAWLYTLFSGYTFSFRYPKILNMSFLFSDCGRLHENGPQKAHSLECLIAKEWHCLKRLHVPLSNLVWTCWIKCVIGVGFEFSKSPFQSPSNFLPATCRYGCTTLSRLLQHHVCLCSPMLPWW